MANFLPPETIAAIRRLSQDGHSVRAIARELGISGHTARRYALRDAKCKCGALAGHNGWCRARYAESPARQAFHAKRRGVEVDVPTQTRRSRVSETVALKRLWLGVGDEWIEMVEPVHPQEHYGIIGEVRHATRRLPIDFREDVQSAMIVACMEGRLARADIVRAVTVFLFDEMRNSRSIPAKQVEHGTANI